MSCANPKPRTQRERALNALECCDIQDLESIVGEAQNQPPLGAADGSIPEALWYLLRDACQAWRKFERVNEAICTREWEK